MVGKSKEPWEEVAVNLVTIEHDEAEKSALQKKNLEAIREAVLPIGIVFNFAFDEEKTIHDRSVVADTGWKIVLGRGLDIFQYFAPGAFDVGNRVQEFRQVKAFAVTYVRSTPKSAKAL